MTFSQARKLRSICFFRTWSGTNEKEQIEMSTIDEDGQVHKGYNGAIKIYSFYLLQVPSGRGVGEGCRFRRLEVA